jgi:cell division protein FtsL
MADADDDNKWNFKVGIFAITLMMIILLSIGLSTGLFPFQREHLLTYDANGKLLYEERQQVKGHAGWVFLDIVMLLIVLTLAFFPREGINIWFKRKPSQEAKDRYGMGKILRLYGDPWPWIAGSVFAIAIMSMGGQLDGFPLLASRMDPPDSLPNGGYTRVKRYIPPGNGFIIVLMAFLAGMGFYATIQRVFTVKAKSKLTEHQKQLVKQKELQIRNERLRLEQEALDREGETAHAAQIALEKKELHGYSPTEQDDLKRHIRQLQEEAQGPSRPRNLNVGKVAGTPGRDKPAVPAGTPTRDKHANRTKSRAEKVREANERLAKENALLNEAPRAPSHDPGKKVATPQAAV